MQPTRLQVKQRFQSLLSDDGSNPFGPPAGSTYTEQIFAQAFTAAYDAVFNAFLQYQCSRITNIVLYTLPPNTLSLTPAQAGITDFADIEEIMERLSGSNEYYTRLVQEDQLSQRPMVDRLLEFVYRWDTFYFVGATSTRQLQITYESSGTAPTDDATVIGIDGSLTFLATFAAGVAAPMKGDDAKAASFMTQAAGPQYATGAIGGELWRIIQPRTRSRQHVVVAPKPYLVDRRYLWRRVPYIAANTPAGGNAVVTFYTSQGTITPDPGGNPAIWYLSYPVQQIVSVTRNGVALSPGVDYNGGANQIIFLAGQIPDPSDNLTVQGVLGTTNTGAPVYVAGPSNAPHEGVPFGAIDGSNNAFVLPGVISGSTVVGAQVIRNNAEMQPGVNYTRSGANLTFLPGYIPQPGDILYAYWWTQ